MNKVMLAISGFGYVFSILFFNISVWNNSDEWMLLEKGYYSLGIATLSFAVISLVKAIFDDRENPTILNKSYLFLSSLMTIGLLAYLTISINNTQWELMEKGYYWMGTFFVFITATMTWISFTVEMSSKSDSYHEDTYNKETL